MNIDAFNQVVAPAVSAGIPNMLFTFKPDGDGIIVTGKIIGEPRGRTIQQVSVPISLSDIDIYSVMFQSLVAMICDRVWQALKDYEAPKQEKKDE